MSETKALNVRVPAELDLRLRASLRRRYGGVRHGALRREVERALEHWLDVMDDDDATKKFQQRLAQEQAQRRRLRKVVDVMARAVAQAEGEGT